MVTLTFVISELVRVKVPITQQSTWMDLVFHNIKFKVTTIWGGHYFILIFLFQPQIQRGGQGFFYEFLKYLGQYCEGLGRFPLTKVLICSWSKY